MLTPFASAYYFPQFRDMTESFLQSMVDLFQPFLQAVLGGYEWGPDLLFERLLLFVLLVAIIFLILGNVPIFEDQGKRIRWLVAIIVPLIGIRFLDYAWLVTIITQYQVLTIVLTSIIPFILYFFFLYSAAGEYPGVRKIGWILFIVVYFGLWSTVNYEANSSVYFWTMVVALVFLTFDSTIYGYYEKQKMKAAGNINKWQHIANIRRDIDEIAKSISQGHIPSKDGERLIKKKQKQLKWITKHMSQ